MTTLGLDETIKKADLIILAEGTPYDADAAQHDGPATVQAKVLRVLKGEYPDQSITLHSWSGMCPYGFVFRKPQEVLFITKEVDAKNGRTNFTRVNYACDTNQLPYENGLVNGKENLDDFAKNHITK